MTRVLWGLGLFMATISVLAYTGTIPVALVQVHGLDKIGHFLLFGSFAAVGVACAQLRAGPGRDVKSIAWVTLVCVLAGIDEAAQQLSPFRSSDVWDFVADVSGAWMLSAAAWIVCRSLTRAAGDSRGESATAR